MATTPTPGINTSRPTGTHKAAVKTVGETQAGGLPRVGDSAHMTPKQDHVSQGVTSPRSDGTGIDPAVVERGQQEDGGKKSKVKGPKIDGRPVRMGDHVGFVTSGDGRSNGKFRPAVVIRTTDPAAPNAERFPIDITVFVDAGKFPLNDGLGETHYREGVLYDENGSDGTYHLLDDTDKIIEALEKGDGDEPAEKKSRR